MKTLKNIIKNFKKDKKGFTLIEIVIVIVIIAILAAMLVPSLISWIDNANRKSFTEACGTIRTSVAGNQSENYAVSGQKTVDWDQVSSLVGDSITVQAGTSAPTAAKTYNVNIADDGTITIYNEKYNGKSQMDGGSWEINEN